MTVTTSVLSEPLPTSGKTLFINAALVGRRADSLYNVLVDAGVVVSISRSELVEVGGDVRVIDLAKDGKQLWISPSLIDWHTHFTMNTLASRRLNLSECRTAVEVLSAVKSAIDDPKYDEGGRLVGVNLKMGEWTDEDKQTLTRAALDEISSTKPIVLIFNGYHSSQLNTPALHFAGVDTTSEDHDGLLLEEDAFRFSTKLQDAADTAKVDTWAIAEADRAASLGITEVVDLEMTYNIPAWQRRAKAGFSSLRVHIGFYPPHLEDAVRLGLKTGDTIPETHELVTAGPFKLITDGSLGSCTAFCCDPYPGTSDKGVLTYDGDAIDKLCRRASESGLRLAVHAIGDAALSLVLDKLEAHAAADAAPLHGSTIEHAQLVNLSDLPRFAALGLTASIQPRHLVDDIELCHAFWPGREPRAYAFKAIVDAGIPIKLGSDCPVAPLEPWDALACAVSRSSGKDGDEVFEKDQILDINTAYAAITSNGKTHIVEGQRADLVVLHADPLSLDAKGLRGMEVEATMLGGRWTYVRQAK